MSNELIAIVGDPHIQPTVSSRLDDYFESCLDKIEQIANSCKHVIFLGDVFSHYRLPEENFNRLWTKLFYLKVTNNNQFYSIVGNHDIPNENESDLDKSALGMLRTTQLVKLIMPDNPLIITSNGVINRFNTTFVRYSRAKEHLLKQRYNTDMYNDILLLHHYYEDHDDCFTYNDLKTLGCKQIFQGHEHCPLPNGKLDYDEFTLYRCGSMMRNIAAPYNFDRQMYYFVINGDKVTCNQLIVKPASEIFTQQAITREKYHEKKFVDTINNIVEKYTNNLSNQTQFSIKTILKEINTPDRNIDYIKTKYETISERFD